MSVDKTANRTYPKPIYAAAGAGELAVEQLKKLPEAATRLRTRVESELKKIDLADVRGKVQQEVNELPSKMQTEFASLSDKVKTEVTQLRGRLADVRRKGVSEVGIDTDKLRSRSTDAVSLFLESAQKQFKVASKQAVEMYEGLAARGQQVITGNGATGTTVARSTQPKASKATATKTTATKTATRATATRAATTKANGTAAKAPAKSTRATKTTKATSTK